MKTITKIGTTFFLLLIMFSAGAQNHQKHESNKSDAERAAMKEKMKTLKVAYITEKIDLTESESKAFWPVYNQYHEEMRELKGNYKGDKKDLSSLSDAELNDMLEAKFEREQKKLDTEKLYTNKLKAIIGVQKVVKLFKAERDFKKEMFEKIKSEKCSGEGGSPARK